MNINLLHEWHTIETEYMVVNKVAVQDLLADKAYLLPLLLELPAQIQPYFAGSHLSLDIFIDPEVEASAKLLMLIATEKEPDAVLDALEAFDSAWWLKNRPRSQGDLIIDVEFA